MVPVPLHRDRQRERGYNQAELIARPLAKRLGLKLERYLLARTRPRPPQLVLSRSEHWKSVRGAYATREGLQVDNLRVLLVDDVLTTGATLDACARALKKAGAAAVLGLTVARVRSVPMIPESVVAAGMPRSRQKPSGQQEHRKTVGIFVERRRGDAMENRHKIGLRPRPTLGLGGVAHDPALPQPAPSPASRPSVMQAPVLVLNATFEPINVTAVRRALVLMLKGVAQAEETNHSEVHSTSKAIQVPSVIRLLSYRHIPQQSRALSRKNILLRDRNTCQFCGAAFAGFGADARPRDAAFARRPLVVGESRGVLLHLQQSQGRPHARRSWAETAPSSAAVHATYVAAVDAPDRASRRKVAEISFLLTWDRQSPDWRFAPMLRFVIHLPPRNTCNHFGDSASN